MLARANISIDLLRPATVERSAASMSSDASLPCRGLPSPVGLILRATRRVTSSPGRCVSSLALRQTSTKTSRTQKSRISPRLANWTCSHPPKSSSILDLNFANGRGVDSKALLLTPLKPNSILTLGPRVGTMGPISRILFRAD